MPLTRRLMTFVLLTLISTLTLPLIGCDADSAPPVVPPATPPAAAEPVRRYTVRGQVQVIDTQAGTTTINHEAIPDFVGHAGTVDPMGAMAMPFEAGPGQDLSGIAAGDKVQFTLAMRWGDRPAYWIESVTQLPAQTPLTLAETGHAGHDH